MYVIVSQWTILLTLTLLLYLLYRQLGRLLRPAKSPVPPGPPLGARAEDFEYISVTEGTLRTFSPESDVPTLVAFVDPTCSTCEHLVTAMADVNASGQLNGIRTLLLISDPPSYLQVSEVFRNTALEIGHIPSKSAVASYHVTSTPLVVAINGDGLVTATGSGRDPADVMEFVRSFSFPPSAAPNLLQVGDVTREHNHHVQSGKHSSQVVGREVGQP